MAPGIPLVMVLKFLFIAPLLVAVEVSGAASARTERTRQQLNLQILAHKDEGSVSKQVPMYEGDPTAGLPTKKPPSNTLPPDEPHPSAGSPSLRAAKDVEKAVEGTQDDLRHGTPPVAVEVVGKSVGVNIPNPFSSISYYAMGVGGAALSFFSLLVCVVASFLVYAWHSNLLANGIPPVCGLSSIICCLFCTPLALCFPFNSGEKSDDKTTPPKPPPTALAAPAVAKPPVATVAPPKPPATTVVPAKPPVTTVAPPVEPKPAPIQHQASPSSTGQPVPQVAPIAPVPRVPPIAPVPQAAPSSPAEVHHAPIGSDRKKQGKAKKAAVPRVPPIAPVPEAAPSSPAEDHHAAIGSPRDGPALLSLASPRDRR